MLNPTVFNTSQICYQLGVKHAVMSPGSRNAPLTISFARHDGIKKWIIPDERSAGFVALGIAQETKTPVVLCCTSGSALLNYAPAIAEAYYREIPLIILSADRPPELIDQRDGQTIRQFESLKNHVKGSFNLPVISNECDIEDYQARLIEAMKLSGQLPKGPVHLNIPFSEPFYPEKDQQLTFKNVEIAPSPEKSKNDIVQIEASVHKRILILIGQNDKDEELDHLLTSISKLIPVIKSPLNNLSNGIEYVDAFIEDQEDLIPDLLVTSGLSVLSKKLKKFLRKHTPKKHFHFDLAGVEVDTYQSDPELIKGSIKEFLRSLNASQVDGSYLDSWRGYENRTKDALKEFTREAKFSESKAANMVLKSIPDGAMLHLSNSMPVRYADLFGVKEGLACLSNRGTSGIDGCTSTAVGVSFVSDRLNVLLTGDLAFLYDRNAFFHNYSLHNLRIIVLNNQGGGIFRLIEGPSNLPELEDYFETRHNRTAEYICAENGIDYMTADDEQSLSNHLEGLFKASDKAKVLEVFTDPEINQKVYKELKKQIHERINN
ncbi:2-succinyl-5-enolpyruvyl-6-hydroxy-3-cyclohexene-1-carboxylic-acid synthase [Ekhidna sp.]|uniref:2-succinyl-5-enolpyruvyl-6-hydroxy-3- cyclohexene-1-carboxylic-acid synthase n=1 Tax=Ekhidna sp. TaxID=2608089 RepID=UPI003B5ABB42